MVKTLAPPTALGTTARLERLKASRKSPGQATFYFWDAHFRCEAVKVMPGEYFVHDEDVLVVTTLGSCIAACLWDRERHIGGMNHFMMPEPSGHDGAGASGRYGCYAMELLINAMIKRGASRVTLKAKVFGGGNVMRGSQSIDIGLQNTRFVTDYLRTERIPIVSQDVLDVYPRKVCFLPRSGKAWVKRLAPTLAGEQAQALLVQDRLAAKRAFPAATRGGSVDLF